MFLVLFLTMPAPATEVKLEKLSILPSPASIIIGTSSQMLAIGAYSDGRIIDVTAQVNWSSRDIKTISLDKSGLANGVSVGQTIVIARLNDHTATVKCTVIPPAPKPMLYPRSEHRATLLPNGKLLVSGGRANKDTIHSSAELYDPTTGKWTATGEMMASHARHTATLLPNGKVLVAGGEGSLGSPLPSAKLYDPITGTWLSDSPIRK
jgi:hypothetical protein